MSQPNLIPLIVAGFILYLVALWLGITALLGWLSGWNSLERAFPDRPEPAIETLTFQSAHMRVVNYNSCLRFEICSTGLRIGVMRLLGPFQDPFFVPWGQVRAKRVKTRLVTLVNLTFGMSGEGVMTVRERTFERFAAIGNLRVG